jgi:hypothetical protein
MKQALIFAAAALCMTSAGIAPADDSAAMPQSAAGIELIAASPEPTDNVAKSDAAIYAKPDRSYLIPAAEIIGFDFLLNQFNRHYSGSSDYDTDWSSIRRNLRSDWDNDKDPFNINQLGHPYQG